MNGIMNRTKRTRLLIDRSAMGAVADDTALSSRNLLVHNSKKIGRSATFLARSVFLRPIGKVNTHFARNNL